MRFCQFLPIVLLFMIPAVSARGADLTPLFPDGAWMVVGFEVKAIYDSPLGRKVIGKDIAPVAARKLLNAFGTDDTADGLKAIASLDPLLERVTRVTAVQTMGGRPRDYEDSIVFLEGEFVDAMLAREMEGLCKKLEIPHKTEKIDERAVHVAGADGQLKWMFRVDKGTVAVAFTRATVADVLARQAGKKKSKAPKSVVEGVQSIDRTANPAWLVVGENRDGDDVVLYSRMVATFSLGEELTLRIRMEAPSEAAAKRSRELLGIYPLAFARSKDRAIWKELGTSARIETNKTVVNATATASSEAIIGDYAKQK